MAVPSEHGSYGEVSSHGRPRRVIQEIGGHPSDKDSASVSARIVEGDSETSDSELEAGLGFGSNVEQSQEAHDINKDILHRKRQFLVEPITEELDELKL
jgi:hypothetical protein